MSSAARTLIGSPDPLPVWVDVHDKDGRPLFHVNARTRESAWAMVLDAPRAADAELVLFNDGRRVWRDASTRSWRTK